MFFGNQNLRQPVANVSTFHPSVAVSGCSARVESAPKGWEKTSQVITVHLMLQEAASNEGYVDINIFVDNIDSLNDCGPKYDTVEKSTSISPDRGFMDSHGPIEH